MNTAKALNQQPNTVGIKNTEASVKILNFLKDKKRKSENTYKNYNRYYSEFFVFVCNKQISEITWEDIFKVTYEDIDNYKRYLINKGDSGNYINQKIFACKALWKKLHTFNHDVNYTEVFDFEREEFEVVNFAALNDKEVELLLNFMDSQKYKPKTKYMFFEFLYIVGCRKNVALELTWNDIVRRHDNKKGIDVWVVSFKDQKFKDKGKRVNKAINDDLYVKLIELKECGESTGDKVFDLSKETFEDVFTKFQDKYNLHEKDGKKVCIHSIKKASGWLVQNTFGDINKTRKHLCHESIELTAKTYIGDEDYCDQASYLIGKNVDKDFFKELDKDTLISLIENSGKDVQMRLYYEYEKMMNK